MTLKEFKEKYAALLRIEKGENKALDAVPDIEKRGFVAAKINSNARLALLERINEDLQKVEG